MGGFYCLGRLNATAPVNGWAKPNVGWRQSGPEAGAIVGLRAVGAGCRGMVAVDALRIDMRHTFTSLSPIAFFRR